MSYTSVYSLTDDLPFPHLLQSVSAQGGATKRANQSIPVRIVDHSQALADAVVYVMVDAFTSQGLAKALLRTCRSTEHSLRALLPMTARSPSLLVIRRLAGKLPPQCAGDEGTGLAVLTRRPVLHRMDTDIAAGNSRRLLRCSLRSSLAAEGTSIAPPAVPVLISGLQLPAGPGRCERAGSSPQEWCFAVGA